MTLLLGAAYYPEHRDPAKWDYDLDMMAHANLNSVRVGEFAWTRFEPCDGDYDFAWMDTFNEKAAQRGITLLLCPPLRTAPAWLVEQDPTISLVREDGIRLAFGSRYTFCINHPLLLDKGAALAEKMAAHYGDDANIVGWHLDNEHGDEPDCHCAICKAKFQQWCEARYGAIAALNEAWGLSFWSLAFQHFGQVTTPRVSKTWFGPGHLLAWRRFRSESTIEAVAVQARAVRKAASETQFITTNNQPLWNPRTDYYDMGQHLDVCGSNYYPPFAGLGKQNPLVASMGMALARSYRQQNFQVHELRNGPHMIPGSAGNTPAPGEVERLTMHTIANGADGVYYFRWRSAPFGAEQSHGSPTDYDGRPKRIYSEVRRVFGNLRRLSDLIVDTSVHSDVAILMDFPTRWVMETGVRWNGPKSLYIDRAKMLYTTVRGMGLNCDAVGRTQDFTTYKVLIVPALAVVDDALADKLVQFVDAGGTLVWHPLSGIKDEEARIYPNRIHPTLRTLLGADIDEFATLGADEPVSFIWQDKRYAATMFCDLPVVEDAEVLGQYVDGWFTGTPAVMQRPHGAGRVMYVTTFAQMDFYRDLFVVLFRQLGITPILDVPAVVEVTARSDEAGKCLIFLMNTSSEAQAVQVEGTMQDVYNEESVSGDVVLGAFEVRVLQ